LKGWHFAGPFSLRLFGPYTNLVHHLLKGIVPLIKGVCFELIKDNSHFFFSSPLQSFLGRP
tara:strand:- start:699 stop:881 length:183 start_codon:yes stop_codon:yes gene_type:complete